MSTEFFEAKQMADDIHDLARVPENLNPEIYAMTLDMIGRMIVAMDKFHMPMAEQRRRMGEKKDELIRELIRLRDRGVLRSGDEGQPKSAPVVVKMESINRVQP